jgi:hypothetical protein
LEIFWKIFFNEYQYIYRYLHWTTTYKYWPTFTSAECNEERNLNPTLYISIIYRSNRITLKMSPRIWNTHSIRAQTMRICRTNACICSTAWCNTWISCAYLIGSTCFAIDRSRRRNIYIADASTIDITKLSFIVAVAKILKNNL